MNPPTPTPGVVARWTTRRRPAAGTPCDECGTPLTGPACEGCGQLAGQTVGMLATVIESDGELRLVIAQRTGRGDWTPIQTIAATPRALGAITRPGATGPAPAADAPTTGGLL
jgi:hypothetical protein